MAEQYTMESFNCSNTIQEHTRRLQCWRGIEGSGEQGQVSGLSGWYSHDVKSVA